jgi:hypothetical protein
MSIAAIVDTIIIWAGAPVVATDLIRKYINLKENHVILAVFIVGLVIWCFGTGSWGMEKICESYRKLPFRKSPSP